MISLLALALASVAVTSGSSLSPPPAHVTAAGETRRMATGSYCWFSGGRGRCVDKIDDRRGPRMTVVEGRRITFRLGFDPQEVTLYTTRRGGITLPARRTTRWKVTGPVRHLSLFVQPEGGGDVSYLARVARR
jgi:hypothetical protein